MKKTNKKGFTIVELVIVIAVIAILAGVLIPTFSSVVTKANESAALQEARNTMTEYLADLGKDIPASINLVVKGGNYYFAVVDGSIASTAYASSDAAKAAFTGTTITVTPTTGSYASTVSTVTIS